jgi:hypothetical protein
MRGGRGGEERQRTPTPPPPSLPWWRPCLDFGTTSLFGFQQFLLDIFRLFVDKVPVTKNHVEMAENGSIFIARTI